MTYRLSFPILAAAIAAGSWSPASSVWAQPPSNWTTITAPQDQATGTNAIGTTVTFQSIGGVHLFSGVTKQWTFQPTSALSLLFQANDYVILRDGNLIHGFSTRRGTVETITTSGAATVVSGPASSSWVTLVADGTQAYGFSAFLGSWAPLTLAAPNPTMVSNRLVGLIRDGSTVYAFSAHHGTFVPVAADPAAQLVVVGEGEVATAHSANVFRAFSAQQNNWVSHPISTASSLQQNEYAMAWSGSTVVAFSGISGIFATYVASASVTGVAGAEGVAAFVDGATTVCYGSGRGAFVTRPAASPSFLFDYNLTLIVEAAGVTPFSGLLGAFGATLPGSYILGSNDDIAYADGATNDFAYSPILNTWTQAPNVPVVGGPVLVRNSVVLPYNGGYYALSARHGDWVQLSSSLLASYSAPASGSTFVAFDSGGTVLSVFDARLNRWATIQGAAPFTLKISRHTAMAHDGVTAFGFGQPNGEWHSIPLTGTPTMDTASSIGVVTHGSEISVYSVMGSLSQVGRFPEFTQAVNLGNTLRMHQVAPPGSALVMLLGLEPTRIELGALLGNLYIDPSFLLTFPLGVTVGPTGVLELAFPLPADQPALVGLQPQFQNVVLPPGGATPWFTSSVSPVLF